MQYLTHYDSPLGKITLASDGTALTGLWLETQKANIEASAKWREVPVFSQVRNWLDLYFQGKDPGAAPPLKVNGSVFHKTVSDIMQEIPYGQTTTYGAIAKEAAKRLGKERMSAQAVGGAVGRNEISIIIPCHRVLGANGKLTGYTGGLDMKIKLLEIEHIRDGGAIESEI